MVYNMDFIISAMIFLTLILCHFMQSRQWDRKNNRIFLIFMTAGLLDIMFDILCTFLVSVQSPKFAWLLETGMILLYVLQAVVPYTLFCYIQTMRHISSQRIKKLCIFSSLPAILSILLVLMNHWLKIYYIVSDTGVYTRGPFYMGIYVNGALYLGAAGLETILYYKEFSKKNVMVVWEVLILSLGSVAIQAVYHDVLMVGFGITLGITVLVLTIKNPYENTDNLTGLYDRQYFHQIIQPLIMNEKNIHVLELHFKEMRNINRIYGAPCGNLLLKKTARKLLELHKDNQVFRIGGNDFLVVTESIERYENAVQGIQNFFQKPIELEGQKVSVSPVICGIQDAENLKSCDEILSYMEYLMSLDVLFKEDMFVEDNETTRKGYHYRKEINSFMGQAIQEDLFEIAYQPIYSTEHGRYVALEALSRLRHPRLGPVSPLLFLELAEKNQQTTQIGLLQFQRVCRFVKEHEAIMKQIRNVKFNLSPVEIVNQEYIYQLIDCIHRFQLKPEYFQFEVTETTATEYCDSLYSMVEILEKEGIRLCLDDFGAGYANLNTVLKLPFSVIKLDRSLLAGICEDPKIAQFYQNIAAIFRRMGYQVVAEGVETEQELRLTGQWGVNLVQGFYYSRPLFPEELLKLLKQDEKKLSH